MVHVEGVCVVEEVQFGHKNFILLCCRCLQRCLFLDERMPQQLLSCERGLREEIEN